MLLTFEKQGFIGNILKDIISILYKFRATHEYFLVYCSILLFSLFLKKSHIRVLNNSSRHVFKGLNV